MKGKPEPGDVLIWRGSHDVLGTREPVIFVEPSIDPQFWVVAALDERGRPTPYTFAVPAEDLHPPRGTLRLLDDPVRGAMLRVAVSAAAVASFALGALSLFGAQPATPIAEGPRPTQAAQIPNAPSPSPALGDAPRRLRYPPFRSFQGESSRVIEAAAVPSSGSDVPAVTQPSTVGAGGGGSSDGGTSGGGTVSGGSGGGGSIDSGTVGDTIVRSQGPPDTPPGNSGSAPGRDSSRGNSASSPGHQ